MCRQGRPRYKILRRLVERWYSKGIEVLSDVRTDLVLVLFRIITSLKWFFKLELFSFFYSISSLNLNFEILNLLQFFQDDVCCDVLLYEGPNLSAMV